MASSRQKQAERKARARRSASPQPTRSCVVTRRRGPPSDFVRLTLGPDGSLCVDYRARLPGRGAWVLPTKANLAKLEKAPKLLQRKLRMSVSTAGLLEQVREANRVALFHAAGVCQRAGVLVTGTERILQTLGSERILAGACATDVADRSRQRVMSRAPQLSWLELPWSKDEFGACIGQAAKGSVLILRSAPGLHFVSELRRFMELR